MSRDFPSTEENLVFEARHQISAKAARILLRNFGTRLQIADSIEIKRQKGKGKREKAKGKEKGKKPINLTVVPKRYRKGTVGLLHFYREF